jgi:argininosuccinate lyase
LADYLVRAGVPFRKAHEAVATVVRVAEDQGVAVNQLPVEAFQEAHSAFGSDVLDVFDWERSLEAREAPGGTARKAVLEQIKNAEACLQQP